MALKTLKVRDIRQLLSGLPDDQDVLLVDADGFAAEIQEIEPLTVTDTATGKQVLTIEFMLGQRLFGFEPTLGVEIDSDEE